MIYTSKKEQIELEKAAREPPVYSKEKLIAMRRYRGRQDLLSVLLEDGKQYTTAEADAAIGQFMKGRN